MIHDPCMTSKGPIEAFSLRYHITHNDHGLKLWPTLERETRLHALGTLAPLFPAQLLKSIFPFDQYQSN